MKALLVFLIIVIIGVGYFFLAYHVVKTDSGTLLVKKQGMRFGSTFVDVKDWEPEDLEKHPRITEALVAAGHQELVDSIAGVPKEPYTGGLGGITDPIIESQQSQGAKKTGGSVKDRAKAIGNK